MVTHATTRNGVEQLDVARRAGVSQKTVSRVINNEPHVSADVRARVQAAIEEMGYRPNPAARALARSRTHVIGMLAVGTTLHGPAQRVFTVEHAARRHGYGMALASLLDLEPDTITAAVRDLLDRGAEGLVIEVPSHALRLDLAAHGGIPVVKSGNRIDGLSRQVVVDVDQAAAARTVTEYLLGLGHETVWHLAGPRDWDAAENRLLGWRSALRDARRRIPRVLVGDWSARSGYRQGRKLAEHDDLTAVFVANDHMAMGLLRALGEAGRRVPEDVSVVGYDDVPEAEFQTIPLTTVRAESPERGADRVLAELVGMIEGRSPSADHVDLPASLIIRASSAPPPAA